MKKVLSLLLAAAMLTATAVTTSAIDNQENTINVQNTVSNSLGNATEIGTKILSFEFNPHEYTQAKLNITPSGQAASSTFLSSYREQLSDSQQQIYDELKEYYISDECLSNGVTDGFTFICKKTTDDGDLTELANGFGDDISYAYCALITDYPELFWAGGIAYDIYYMQNNNTFTFTTNLEISEEYSGAKSAVNEYNSAVKIAAAEIYESTAANFSPYNCYKAIHDYLCDKLTYNYDALNDSDTYDYAYSSGAVFNGPYSVVCEGYAEAFKVLCDQIQLTYLSDKEDISGLQSILVRGYAYTDSSEGGAHVWNYAVMPDNEWYAVDVTWDDQELTGTQYNYFLCGSNSDGFYNKFSEDHVESNSFTTDGSVIFTYPAIAENTYFPDNDVVVDLTQHLGSDTSSDIDTDSDTDTSSDINTDSDSNTDISSDIDTDSDTDTSSDIDTDSDTDTDTSSDIDTDSDTDTLSDIDTESDTDTSSDIDTDSDTDTSSDIDTDSDTDTSSDIDTDSDTDTSSDIDTDSDTDTSSDIDTDSDTDTSSDIDTDSDTDTSSDIDTDTDTDSDSDIDKLDFDFTVLDNGTIEITGYSGDVNDIVIPETIDDKKVTSIGTAAFSECPSLTSISIPDSVTNIGEYAFDNCDNITIYGNSGSYAEKYAAENNITFVSIGSEILMGDINGDGSVSLKDASLIQQYSIGLIMFTEAQKTAADINGDGTISLKDASLIQQMSIGLIV